MKQVIYSFDDYRIIATIIVATITVTTIAINVASTIGKQIGEEIRKACWIVSIINAIIVMMTDAASVLSITRETRSVL